MKTEQDLHRLQRWFAATVTHPHGVEHGAAAAGSAPERLVTASRSLSPAARLRIYADAYEVRLVQCLRADFPALRVALGDDVFDDFARAYIAAEPPRDYALALLGASFPQFLSRTRPGGGAASGRPDWTDFVVELATLERTFREAFDDSGPEDAVLPAAPDVDALSSAPDWRRIRVTPAPWLRLATFAFPVHRYMNRVRASLETPVPEPEATHLAISRHDYTVRFDELTQAQHALLAAFDGARELHEALHLSGHHAWRDAETSPGVLRETLHAWARRGFFARVELPPAI
jgi:hypothetical protein